jgi:hypothetical protein
LYIIIIIISYLRFPSLVLLFSNQWCTRSLRFQASDPVTFLITCAVPSTAVSFAQNLLKAFVALFPDIFF